MRTMEEAAGEGGLLEVSPWRGGAGGGGGAAGSHAASSQPLAEAGGSRLAAIRARRPMPTMPYTDEGFAGSAYDDADSSPDVGVLRSVSAAQRREIEEYAQKSKKLQTANNKRPRTARPPANAPAARSRAPTSRAAACRTVASSWGAVANADSGGGRGGNLDDLEAEEEDDRISTPTRSAITTLRRRTTTSKSARADHPGRCHRTLMGVACRERSERCPARARTSS